MNDPESSQRTDNEEFEEQVGRLVSMGFEAERSRVALQHFQGHKDRIERAVKYLLDKEHVDITCPRSIISNHPVDKE
jgi:hypothetical protein